MIEFLHGWFPVPSDVIFNVLSIFDKRSSVGGDRYPLERHKRHITALNGVSFRLNHNSIILNHNKYVSGLNIYILVVFKEC